MSFETDVARNGPGSALQLEVGYLRFTTVSYFLSNVAHLWAGTTYDPRIVSIGRLQRGLTNDHNLAASTVEVVLDNTDGGMDWLVNRDTVETSVFQAKFRLYAVSYDPASPDSLSRKQLGQFGLLDWPRRTEKTITLMLADDTSIDGAEFAIAPSLKDWVTDAGSNPGNNPLCESASVLVSDSFFFLPYESPIQLAFGNVAVPCQKGPDLDSLPGSSPNFSKRAVMVCATTDVSGPQSTDVEKLYIRTENISDFNQPGFNELYTGRHELPKTVSVRNSATGTVLVGTVWEAKRSQVLTKDGRQWRLIWVQLNMVNVFLHLVNALGISSQFLANAMWRASGGVPSLFTRLDFEVEGWPYSARTVPSSNIGFGTGVRAPEVAYDLLCFYSHNLNNSDVDLPSFQRATQVLPGFFASGVIDDTAEISTRRGSETEQNARLGQDFIKAEAIGGRLRQVLADLARSGSFDMFVSWDDVFKATAQTSLFTDQLAASSLLELDETLIVDGQWEDRVPSPGERWAPHNRLYIEGLHGRIGPFDNAAKIAAWGRKLPATLSTKWVNPADYAIAAASPNINLFNSAAVESKARQRVRFVYGSLEALQLDLGSYFKLSLKRGTVLNPVFSSAVFKVEQIDLLPTLGVFIEAIWFDDLLSDRPYFLDDESYSLVVASTPGRTATVADSSTTVTFASGSLTTDTVAAGDVLVLKDITLGATAFSRFRALRIATVTDATHLVISDSDLDFGGGNAVADWEIHRGATTYSLLQASDPTHYPTTDYPPLYGKVTNSTGVFSNAGAGNKLLDG